MSNKAYAPYIESVLPAFIWDNEQIIINIPLEHHQTIGPSSTVGFALQIKDALQEDNIEPIIIKKDYSATDLVWSTNIVSFQLNNSELINRIKIGRFYKCAIAYLTPGKRVYNVETATWETEPSEIGYWSTVGIAKCTRLATPLLGLTAGFQASFAFPYTSNDSWPVDIAEKLYSVELNLYDSQGSLLEKSGEIIVNYQLQTDTNATILYYQFNTYFSNPSFQELVNSRAFIYNDIISRGEDLGVVRYDEAQSAYVLQKNNVIVNEFNDQYQYTEEFITVAEAVYNNYPELWATTYKVIANYKTINNYTGAVIREDIAFDFISSNQDLEVCVANDYDNGLINISFRDASPGGLQRDAWQQETISGEPVGWDDVSDLIDSCYDFNLIRKNLITQQCIRLFHSDSLKNFFYKEDGYQDLGIEQGVSYEYILTYAKTEVVEQVAQTKRLFTKSSIITADFEDCFIYDESSQLKLAFNPKVSSYKYNIPQAKQETIGGKFPFIFENRAVCYKEFPISFLISHLEDKDCYFANGLTGKYEFLKNIMVKAKFDAALNRYNKTQLQYLSPIEWKYLPSTQLTTDNLFIERQFKMAVLDWLTNGKPKIFKSPAEGNVVIKLINVSLAPEDKLGRMLHTLSGTAIEIEEYSDKYLQTNNLLLYQISSNKTIGTPIVPTDSVLLEKLILNNGGLAYVFSVSNQDLIETIGNNYYLIGQTIIVKDETEETLP